jgi:hypothetical protein
MSLRRSAFVQHTLYNVGCRLSCTVCLCQNFEYRVRSMYGLAFERSYLGMGWGYRNDAGGKLRLCQQIYCCIMNHLIQEILRWQSFYLPLVLFLSPETFLRYDLSTTSQECECTLYSSSVKTWWMRQLRGGMMRFSQQLQEFFLTFFYTFLMPMRYSAIPKKYTACRGRNSPNFREISSKNNFFTARLVTLGWGLSN